MSQKDRAHGSWGISGGQGVHVSGIEKSGPRLILISNSTFLLFQMCFSCIFHSIFSYLSQTESFALYGSPRPWVVVLPWLGLTQLRLGHHGYSKLGKPSHG